MTKPLEAELDELEQFLNENVTSTMKAKLKAKMEIKPRTLKELPIFNILSIIEL